MAGKVVRIAGMAVRSIALRTAFDMVAKGNVRYLCMDGLAERSLALLQMRMLAPTCSIATHSPQRH
jgi:hypothetical protein